MPAVLRSRRHSSQAPLPATDSKGSAVYLVAPVAIVLLGAGLRLHTLAAQGLWDDEGISYARAASDLRFMLTSLPAEQLPLYYVLLHLWVRIWGQGLWLMRASSVLPGILVVPLTFSIGRRWFGVGTGLVAAALTAVSAPLVYQSQTVRLYPLLTCLALVCAAAALELISGAGPKARLAYLLSASALALTHLLGVLIIALVNVAALLQLRQGTGGRPAVGVADEKHRGPALCNRATTRPLWGWLLLQGGVATVLVVWVLFAVTSQGHEETLGVAGGNALGLLPFLNDMADSSVLAPGAGQISSRIPVWVPLLSAAVIGLVAPARACSAASTVTLFLLGFGPGLLVYVLGRLLDVPLYLHYLIPGAPVVYLAAALGLQWIRRGLTARKAAWAGGLAGACLLGCMLLPLQEYYLRSVEDLAPLAQQIAVQGRPGDALVLSSLWRSLCYDYYDRSGLPRYPEPSAEQIHQIANTHQRVWLVVFGNRPTSAISDGIMHAWFTLGRWNSGTTELLLYQVSNNTPQMTQPLAVAFGPSMELLGFQLQPEEPMRGALIQLTLWWRASAQTGRNYKVFVHLVGPDGRTWAQHDAEPADGTRPTPSWQPGEIVVDRHALQVPEDAPLGDYQLWFGVYDRYTLQRLIAQDHTLVAHDGALQLASMRIR